jgi:hypothetical protein
MLGLTRAFGISKAERFLSMVIQPGIDGSVSRTRRQTNCGTMRESRGTAE